ncbi:unnamed protein product [Lymnaea stagnalis]|uniref:Uncharacterized protein n=1 Tax=Lymnaea stagnalis TaxID=6523 RepID=A0AAV2IC80_LYMST
MATNTPLMVKQTDSPHDPIHSTTTSGDQNLAPQTDHRQKPSRPLQGGAPCGGDKLNKGAIPRSTNKKLQNNEKNAMATDKTDKSEVAAIPQTNFAIGLLVLCCFNLPFGALALYFSLRAAAAYRDGEKEKGAYRSRLSILCSLFGIMVTMVMVSSVVVYIAVNKHSSRIQRRPNPKKKKYSKLSNLLT